MQRVYWTGVSYRSQGGAWITKVHSGLLLGFEDNGWTVVVQRHGHVERFYRERLHASA